MRTNLTKIAAAIAGVGAVVALSACSSTDAPKAPVAEQTTPAQTDDAFIQALASAGEPQTDQARTQYINLAHAECEALDAGNSVESVIQTGIESGAPTFTPEDVGTILGSAIRFYCPQYTDDAMSAANTAGA